jgi:beta-galactosidase
MILGVLGVLTWSQQQTMFTSFKPGTVWPANDGIHIDCHGGNIVNQPQAGTYYWYGEHYSAPAGVACYSSKDLYNWKNEGVVVQRGAIPVLERPKVVYNTTTKKYAMWFHYDNSNYGLANLGVAVSDSAKGPFTLVNHFRPNGHQSRDIGMYCDDDGKVYIIYAADSTNVTIRIVELTSDYLNVTTNDSDIKAHCEGPAMLKVNGTYYLITSQCSGWSPNKATCYTATNIMGPYTNRGTPCVDDTNNITFNSQSCYIFKVPGYATAFMFMGDRWNGSGNANAQYVFLPIIITSKGTMQLRWLDEWDFGYFFMVPSTSIMASATSQEPGNTANQATDENLGTLWQTAWTVPAALPQSLTLNLGDTYTVSSLEYVPRQDGNHNGIITSYTISTSSDGNSFTQQAAGAWKDDASVKTEKWTGVSARYIRLTATTGHGGYASIDEINVFYNGTSLPVINFSQDILLQKSTCASEAFKIVGAPFRLPSEFTGRHAKVFVYDIDGKLLTVMSVHKNKLDLHRDCGLSANNYYIVKYVVLP